MKHFILFASIIFASMSASAQPRLIKHGNATQIEVNGRPMLMIGGETGNSSATTLDDCQRTFSHLAKLGLNTVLVPAYWNLIEPKEGEFDFTTIDNVITEARKNKLKVVLLWFGAWKNSMSCYAPLWFKQDSKRFPRAHSKVTVNGKEQLRPVEEASSLSKNVLEADKKAFCKLMQYIRDKDSNDQTVIMVQVENEIGMIDVPRDYSTDATKLYNSSVPQDIIKASSDVKNSKGKNWPQVFGDNIYTEEKFQAWTYAMYVEQMAKAGKAIYNIPMYVNVALNSRNRKPGEYPSAGPLAHLLNIWKAAAPSIDVYGLDLYDKGFRDWTAKYHMPNDIQPKVSNPLFIPEIRLEDQDGVRAFYAFGHHSAMGFCPFSIEDYPILSKSAHTDMSGMDLSQDDQLNAFSGNVSTLSPIAAAYSLLRQTEHLILDKQGTNDIFGIHLDNNKRSEEIITPDGIRLTVKHSYSLGWEPGSKSDNWPEVACIILRQGKNDYIVIGSGVVITYEDSKVKSLEAKDGQRIGLGGCEVMSYSPDKPSGTVLRHLSGDQTHQGRHVRIPVNTYQIQHFNLYRY